MDFNNIDEIQQAVFLKFIGRHFRPELAFPELSEDMVEGTVRHNQVNGMGIKLSLNRSIVEARQERM